MANIVTLDSAPKLPSFLKPALGESSLTTALAALATAGFPVISIKGKTFSVVRNGKSTLLTRKVDDEDVPASYIDCIIVNASSHFTKTFYTKGYEEGAKEKPDCFSNDGVKPDAQSPVKQCATCAACPKNAWGSSTTGAGKACADVMRLAVAAPDTIVDPMLIRVPPASLKVVTQYAKALGDRGIPVEGSITRIKFESSEATPKLILQWKGYVTEEQYKEVQEVRATELVATIVGHKTGTPVLPAAEPDDDDDAPAPKSKKAAPPQDDDDAPVKPKKEAKKPAPPADDDDDAPAPKTKKAAAPPADDDDAPAPKTDTKSKASALASRLAASLGDDDMDD